MKIYTKKGDQGQTQLIGGSLVAKSDLRIESYGSVDELGSWLGLTQFQLQKNPDLSETSAEILMIQNELFCIGSLLACEDPDLARQLPAVPEDAISRIENSIDRMTSALPPLREFILPGGSELSALFHLCRTTCRRAERNTVRLLEQHDEVLPAVIYLNRLSDYLFTCARHCNAKSGVPDNTWKKP